ncbi:Cytochrome c-type biogenesis protein CcmG/DsbE, thiol:disulfide oxidoreductase [hydrothermal vent metagenome]|uniref:Cytochrome c-type biogenesis protein CcmG/DsbE, thiol:disulfide oxidoreductase n=1 Tax=hydrothermal vent metagenome TaxID=652676 RepID=A0A3B0SN19_9ZZZZ
MNIKPVAFIPLLVLVAIGLLFAVGLRNDPKRMPSVLIDRQMPDFVLEPVLTGQEVFQPSDLLGRVSLVNVFGSWCAACMQEHPTLMRLARQNRIAIYGVDWRDTAEAGAAWLAKNGNPYTKVGLDAHSKLAIDLGVTGAPETYLVDNKGRIRFKQIGPITDQVWRQTIEPIVLKLEAQP